MSTSKNKHPPTMGEQSDEPPAKSSKTTTIDSAPISTSRDLVSITDVGAIKVSSPKKTAVPKALKRKAPKAKRPKIDNSKRLDEDIGLLDSVVETEDAAQRQQDADDDDMDSIDENEEEYNTALPWDKSPYNNNESKDIITTAMDEIALEGLDGITLEAFWTRLAIILNQPKPLSTNLMQFVWASVVAQRDIQFFTIDKPRGSLTVPPPDVYPDITEEIYPFVPIKDEVNNIIGSCSTYNERQPLLDISDLTLDRAEALGNHLILVASQDLRNSALLSPFADPLVSFTELQYYILEKIGRSRRRGETTTGPRSLSVMSKDAKTLFYYRNRMQQNHLIAKQPCSMRTDKNTNSAGGLVHLLRFYTEIKSKRQLIIEHVVKLIKQKPAFRMEYMELRRVIGSEVWEKYMMSKVIKSTEFRQVVKTDMCLPYREVYPDAKPSEWKQKAKDTEKTVRVLELRNPNLNVNSIFKDEKEEIDMNKDSGSDSDAEFDAPFNILSAQRIYQSIYNAGKAGINMRALSKQVNCDHHHTRTVCKNLKTAGVIDQTLQDSKRQHFMLFVATAHLKCKDPTTAESSKTTTPEHNDDDETLDYISDVLNVDAECLKGKANDEACDREVPESDESENVTNPYQIIQELKKVKDIENLNTYFANQHSFSPAQLRLLKPQKTEKKKQCLKNTKTQKFMSSIFEKLENANKPKFSMVVKEETNQGSNFDTNVEKKIRGKIKYATMKRIKSFKPFKCLLNNKYQLKLFDTYMEMFEHIKQEKLSSSDDEPNEDLNSEDTLISGLDIPYKETVPEEIKRVIIEHFENEKVVLREKFNEPLPSAMNTNAVKAEKLELTRENFFNVDMEMFMGPKPQVISLTKDKQDVETMLVVSTKPQEFDNRRALVSNSQRVQSRIKLVKECINKQKLIADIIKVQAIIFQAEKAEGYNVTVDRKSLQRIFTTLVREGEFKIVKIILKFKDIVRTKNMMTIPTFDVDTLMHSIVDQFKNSFIIYAKRKVYEQEGKLMGIPNPIRRRFKYSRFIGRTYGFNPKASKIRILHEYLYYLVREYTGTPRTREETRNVLLHYCNSEGIDDVMNEATTLYQREATWKMFVPPLPQHKSWPTGWALISDILLRLPLSLFVKLYNVSFIIPELPSYLNHPVRKNFIVKNMPTEIKDALLGYRKYIYAIHEIFCYLAYLGLIQFGPQKMREKDQVFFYLNTKAIIFDTTSSEPGYHHITQKEYPKLTYQFTCPKDLDDYWSDMYCYAIHTKLGNRLSVIGQSIKLEYVHSKPLLMAALKAHTADSAVANDVGYLPGDGLGACCADSALWLHVKKNWFWYAKAPKNKLTNQQVITGLRRKHLEDVRPMKLSDIHHHRKGKKFKVIGPAPSTAMATGVKRSKIKIIRTINKKKIIMRKVNPRKYGAKVRVRVDAVDRKILDHMGKSRAVFSPEEDKLILICLACCDYITAFNKKRAVASTTIRDFIHCTMPFSRKTSLAYRRRGAQLRKTNNLEDQKDVLNFKLSADFFTEKHFGTTRNNLKRDSGKTVSELHFNLSFVYLAHCTYKRWKANPSGQTHSNSETLQDFLAPETLHRYKPISEIEETFCKDPSNENEINMDTIQSVIHSSLGTQISSQDWPFQLLRVYQSFSEDLLRSALINLRDHQIISGRKMKQGQEGTILMSGITYNLSFNYTFKQITQFPHCIFTEAHQVLVTLIQKFEHIKTAGLSIEKFEQGHGLGIGEYQTNKKMKYYFDLPDDIITLNPNLNDFSELIKELTQRYNELMKKTQESEDSTYDPEVITHLQATLENFIISQREEQQAQSTTAATAASSSSSSSTAETATIDKIEKSEKCEKVEKSETKVSDYGNFAKADRRHKTWKISDMAFMLTKGLFPELDDDERLEKLNEHFIVRYPTCRIQLDDEIVDDDPIFQKCHFDITSRSNAILDKVLHDSLIRNTLTHLEEHELDAKSNQLLNFIYLRNNLGATSKDIKRNFPNLNLKLLEHLIDVGLVLRVGVCSFFFVHHNYRHNWSIYLNTDNNPNYDKSSGGYRVRICPWIRINGTLHSKLLEKWMSIILSHCLSYPCITFNRLCARFNIIKPIDVYYILEILQRLGCLQIWTYVRDDEGQDIFTEFGILPQVPGSIIDDLDDVFVETETAAITKFGAFLNRNKTEFAYAFEEEE